MPETGVNATRVCLALSVPLSGFLSTLLAVSSSRTLWRRFSGPSVPGILPFRVFLPSKSSASLKAVCSLALRRQGCGRHRQIAWTPELCSLRGSLLAGQSLHSTRSRYSPGVSQLWGVTPFRPWPLHETLPLPHFHSPSERPAPCPRVLLPEERHSSKERAYPSAVFSLFSLSNLFDGAFVDGLFFRRTRVLALLRKPMPHP